LVDPSFEVGILSPMENEDVFLGKQFFLKKTLSCSIQSIRMIRVLYGIRSGGPEETGMVELGLLNDRASLQLTL
jgi:hypothetical protein